MHTYILTTLLNMSQNYISKQRYKIRSCSTLPSKWCSYCCFLVASVVWQWTNTHIKTKLLDWYKTALFTASWILRQYLLFLWNSFPFLEGFTFRATAFITGSLRELLLCDETEIFFAFHSFKVASSFNNFSMNFFSYLLILFSHCDVFVSTATSFWALSIMVV